MRWATASPSESATRRHVTAAGNDYRVLQPRLVMDANRNRSRRRLRRARAGRRHRGDGQARGATVGRPLTGFDADLTETVVLAHLADPLAEPHGDPAAAPAPGSSTTCSPTSARKTEPQPQPAVVYTLARETHDSDPAPAGEPKMQHAFAYSDGFGREIQKKIQAEPGPVPSATRTARSSSARTGSQR